MRTFGEFLNWIFPVARRTRMLGTAIGTIVVAFGISAKQAGAIETNASVKPAQVEMQGLRDRIQRSKPVKRTPAAASTQAHQKSAASPNKQENQAITKPY